MYGYIYLTTNNINNKIYIGQKKSKTFLNEKYLGSGVRLASSIDHYGKENFSVKLLEECDSAEELNEREIYYIAKYDATNPDIGYNLSIGGGNTCGLPAWNKGISGVYTHSQETKDKMSQTRMGHATTQETKDKISKSNSGKKRTEEQNEANRLRNKNKRWIHNADNKSTTVQLEDLQMYLDNGWMLGRGTYNTKSWNKGQTKQDNPIIARYAKDRKDRLDKGEKIGFCQRKIQIINVNKC